MRCTPCQSPPLTHPQRAELDMSPCRTLEPHNADAMLLQLHFAHASSSSQISRDVMHLMVSPKFVQRRINACHRCHIFNFKVSKFTGCRA